MWTCQKCGRKFERKNQSHSCNIYPLDKHFEGKEHAKVLYNRLKEEISKEIGPFTIESLSCCIHFVTTFTFAAVYALKDKIRVNFTLNYDLKNSRLVKVSQMSANRYLYDIDIRNESEIDGELISLLKQAYNLKKD